MRLPHSLDELAGLRAARWVRESTSGQFDAFGPDAQREQQDRAIERWGLVDTALSWQVAHSGRTVGSTTEFREMLDAAAKSYDVLVVGYVSRFARDLRTAVNARHDLHAAGAVLLFADERILSSEEDRWDEWAREAVEAESYSRKLARRIREGYAAKRRRLGEPGGRPPYGFERLGRPPRLAGLPDRLSDVRRVFDDAAAGRSDRDAAIRSGLPLDTVRGILTNPIYVGRLRDGSAAAVEPVVDVATWSRVQAIRAERNHRAGRPSVKRTYALPMLTCAFCSARLKGDGGRYRHTGKPCPEFVAARPRQRYRNRLYRTPGMSYRKDRYEGLVGPALTAIGAAFNDALLTEAADAFRSSELPVDQLALRRVDAGRDRALTAYRTHRTAERLEADMARFDSEEARLRQVAADTPDWRSVLAVLRDAPAMWEEATDAERRVLATELFRSVEALGGRGLRLDTWDGVQAVAMVGARGFAPTITITRAPWRLEAESA